MSQSKSSDRSEQRRDRHGIPAIVFALALLFALWCATFIAAQPGRALAIDADAAQFSAGRALEQLGALLRESAPHPMGSAANRVVRERILTRLRQLGYEPELQPDTFGCDLRAVCGTPVNIVVRLGTAADPTAAGVLLSAHYDSVPAGPGASDDGAGVAEALEIARILKLRPPPLHPIVLLINDGEELGLLGARVFVDHHPWAAGIKAAVNIDNRGTSGPALMFETGSANAWLMDIYARHISHPATNSFYYTAYKQLPNNTDFTIYKQAGWQGFNFAFIGDVAHYHTPDDDPAHADARSIQQQGDAALASLWALANSDLEHASAGDAVYFDLFGRTLIRAPSSLVLPAAVLTLVAALCTAVILARRTRGFTRELCWGMLGQTLAWIFAALLALALLWGLRSLARSGSAAHTAFAWIPNVLYGAVGALAIALESMALRGRVQFAAFWCATVLLVAALAVLVAATLPGVSYVLLLPSIVGTLTLLWRRLEGAVLLYLAVMFILLWPLLIGLYDGVGIAACAPVAVLMAVGAAPFACLLVGSSLRVDRWLASVACGLIFAGSLASLALPAYTIASPEGLNIRYWIDQPNARAARAQWLVVEHSRSLSPDLQTHVLFHRLAPEFYDPLLDFGDGGLFVAAAPLEQLPAPQFELLTVQSTTGATSPALAPAERRRFVTRIASLRGAAMLAVAFPAESGVDAVTVRPAGAEPGEAVAVTPLPRDHGWKILAIANPPVQGIELAFDASATPFDVRLVDRSYGLPAPGRVLQGDRPATMKPVQEGDVTVITTSAHVATVTASNARATKLRPQARGEGAMSVQANEAQTFRSPPPGQ